MRMISSYITLQDVHFHAFHGVMPQEKRVGGDFLLNLRVGYSLSAAMESDRLEDTISYAALFELVAGEMRIPSKLLEHVAGRMVHAIMSAYPAVSSIDLEIVKQNPPMGADCAGASVEIHLINDKTLE
jgi:dihydroneopterin aldolase